MKHLRIIAAVIGVPILLALSACGGGGGGGDSGGGGVGGGGGRCALDNECGTGVCDVETSACVVEAEVLYVTATGGAASIACAKSDPCTLTKAITLVSPTRFTILMAPGSYTTSVDIDMAQTVVIHGYGATMRGLISMRSSGIVRIRGHEFLGDGGLSCQPANPGDVRPTFDLYEVSFDSRASTVLSPISISSNVCTLIIQRSKFKTKTGGTGIYGNGQTTPTNRGSELIVVRSLFEGGDPAIGLYNYSVLRMKNSVVMRGTASTFVGLGYDISATGTIDFSTFINWQWGCGNGGGVFFTTSNSVFYQNLNGNNVMAGSRCEHHYTLMFPQAFDPGGSNNIFGMDPMLKDVAAGDFHLLTGSPAINKGDPVANEAVDFEGTARPQDGRRDIGAFEYK